MPSEVISQLLTPEIWTGLVGLHIKKYKTPMKSLTRSITDYASGKLSLGAIVPMPYADEKKAKDRGALLSVLSFPEPKGDKSLLTINKNKVVTLGIPDQIISSLTKPYINEQTREVAVAMVNQYEQDILKEIKTKSKMGFSTTEINQDTIKDVLTDAIEAMDDEKIPANDRFLVLDNKSYKAILSWLTTIPFAKADDMLNTGIIGEIFGLELARSTFTDGIYFGHRNGLVHADSLNRTKIGDSVERLGTLVVSEMVYGTTAPREGAWLGKVTVKEKS